MFRNLFSINNINVKNAKYAKGSEKATAKESLENDEIIGYMILEENEPKIVVKNSGINETIFKYVTEEITEETRNSTNYGRR